ncbi:hypothetical protein WN51_11194 [Melipona quadrifasciata]|uniref:C2H2-type domain-containing protein n=1 Tax=Melipona quadrifasciata TaxID=166423 RepID=A0A0M9A3Z8_9HYME|nr:hypothetical protein WN51_11194 [Melipona quadrifasciata]
MSESVERILQHSLKDYGIVTEQIVRQMNGHMLTHRNKKPYECKAEGCGKSYCDARSLRRHTENHHAGSRVNESVSPSSPTTGPHTPNTPGSNPSTPSTPGATSTTNGHGHPALKQLLATEPTQAQQQKNIPNKKRKKIAKHRTIDSATVNFHSYPKSKAQVREIKVKETESLHNAQVSISRILRKIIQVSVSTKCATKIVDLTIWVVLGFNGKFRVGKVNWRLLCVRYVWYRCLKLDDDFACILLSYESLRHRQFEAHTSEYCTRVASGKIRTAVMLNYRQLNLEKKENDITLGYS